MQLLQIEFPENLTLSDEQREQRLLATLQMLHDSGFAMLPENSEITHRDIARCIAEYFYQKWNPMYVTMSFRLEGVPTSGNDLAAQGKPDEFKPLVAAMRQAQKSYFKTRSHEALLESKRLEKMVDEAIKSISEQ